MTFSEYTDTWFDKLCRENLRGETSAAIRQVVTRKIADHRAINQLRELADTLGESSIELVAHIDALIANQFKTEFALRYSRQSAPQVSAASELFSMVRQAIDYMPKTVVMFRVDKKAPDDIFALFPELPGTHDPKTCSCYVTMGGHTSADLRGCIATSRPATPQEYAELVKELKRYGYDMLIVDELRPYHNQARLRELKR